MKYISTFLIYTVRTLQIIFFIGATLFTAARFAHIISLTNNLVVYGLSNEFNSGQNLTEAQATFQHINDQLFRTSTNYSVLLAAVSILSLLITEVRRSRKRYAYEGLLASVVLLGFTLTADLIMKSLLTSAP
jgi:ABC-type xylose transport system permease subunit